MALRRPITHIITDLLQHAITQIAIDSVDQFLGNPNAWYVDAMKLTKGHPDEEKLQVTLHRIWDIQHERSPHG